MFNHRQAFVAAFLVGTFNVVLLSSLRNYIPQLFTNDPDVIKLVASGMFLGTYLSFPEFFGVETYS